MAKDLFSLQFFIAQVVELISKNKNKKTEFYFWDPLQDDLISFIKMRREGGGDSGFKQD